MEDKHRMEYIKEFYFNIFANNIPETSRRGSKFDRNLKEGLDGIRQNNVRRFIYDFEDYFNLDMKDKYGYVSQDNGWRDPKTMNFIWLNRWGNPVDNIWSNYSTNDVIIKHADGREDDYYKFQ